MTPPDTHADHLAELRRRWEEDPGSRLFLQLGEEYRRAGRHQQALEVLEKGMESHPQQVSGLVSLGRVHLALEQPGKAASALEKAVEIDPTNPMAMKLATEAHLQAGDRDVAGQRLELYKLLNSGDPEVEALEARIEGREPVPPSPSDEEPSAVEPVPMAAEEPAAEEFGDGQGWSATAAWPSLPGGSGTVASLDADPPVSANEAADAVSGGYASEFGTASHDAETARPDPRPEPFAGLAAHGAERLYLTALAAEGLFPLDLEPEPDEVTSEPWEPLQETTSAAFESADEQEMDSAPWQFVDSAGTGTEASPRPTVTLGQLYLDQGHQVEALAIFDAVLERDPDNEAATEGRQTALGADSSRQADVTLEADFTLKAHDLLRDADPAQPPKVSMLRAYLQRVRGARAS